MEQAAREAPAEPGAVTMEQAMELVRQAKAEVQEAKAEVQRAAHTATATASAHSAPHPAAPWHVWVCVGAVGLCAVLVAVMAGAGIVGAFWLSREFSKMDNERNDLSEETMRMQSLLSAIYVRAPQLKPEDFEKQQAEWDEKRKQRRRAETSN